MSTVTLIHYYNRLNGNSISLPRLKEFHERVQKQLDADGHGTYAKDLKGIYERVSKAIKKMIAEKKDMVERLNVELVELVDSKQKAVGKPVSEKVKVKSEKQAEYLSGLDCLQDDQDYTDEALGDITNSAYQVITDRILELIQDNGLIWRQPWDESKAQFKTQQAHNYVTRHVYRGGNSYLTWLFLQGGYVRTNKGKKFVQFSTPYFFSFKQITNLGGKVKAGEKGWPVIYFKWLYKNLKTGNLVTEGEAKQNGKLRPGFDEVPGIFYYVAFNYDQTEGLEIAIEKRKPRTEAEKIESAEAIVASMPAPPKIVRTGKSAFYRRADDLVEVPPMTHFKKEQQFYSVLFHELIHSTGHEKRVYREREASRRFGDANYAFEELIAELGASFLCGDSGILYFTLKNSAAYIKNWSGALVKQLKADPKFYFKAAGQAQKAADYIMDRIESKPSEAPAAKEKKKPSAKERTMPAPMKQVAGVPASPYQASEKEIKAFVKLVNRYPDSNEFLWQDFEPKDRTTFGINTENVSRLFQKLEAGVSDYKISPLGASLKQTIKSYAIQPGDNIDRLLYKPAKSKKDKAPGNRQPVTKSPSGVTYDYKEVDLGPYKKDFHRMMSDTIVQIHGLPGHGKTVWLLKYAQYRAENGANVLYVAREEHGRSVFDVKLKEHNIGHANLRFRKYLEPEDIKWATVIFLDSASASAIDHKELERLTEQYPNRNWYPVLQSTKDGDFLGSQKWEHLVDIAGEVRNRKLILRKNRLDPNNSTKAEKLNRESAITEARKKAEVRNAVKKAMNPEPEPETAKAA